MPDEKTYVSKSVTVPLDDITLNDYNAAAELVSAPSTARVSSGGPVVTSEDNTQVSQYSATFSWSEEV